MSSKLVGKRFSHVYLVRGEPEKDSKKARFRLAKLAERSCPPARSGRHGPSFDYNEHAQERIENELGIKFGTLSTAGMLIRSWEWYFNKVSVAEMLDTITVVAASLQSEYRQNDRPSIFLAEARRILKEENLAYEIDERGGVHPLVDSTFSASMESAISGMNNP